MMSLKEFNELYNDFTKSRIFNIKFMAAVRLYCSSSEIIEYTHAEGYTNLIDDINNFFRLVYKLEHARLSLIDRVTNTYEVVVLWELLGNETAKQEVSRELIQTRSCLLLEEDYDIENYLNASYTQYLRQPRLNIDEQAQVQSVLVNLGGELEQGRIWFSAKIVADFLLSPVASFVLSFRNPHKIHLIYFLLYVHFIANDGIEVGILFNLIQFSFFLEAANINGKSKKKFYYVLDLLWYRISILLWGLAAQKNIKPINVLLGEEGTIDEKIYFFKIISLFYFDKIIDKSKFTDQSHAESLDCFLRDSLSPRVYKLNQLSFVSLLFEQNFFQCPENINDFSVRGLFLLYLKCCRKKVQNEYLIQRLCGYIEKQSRDLETLCLATTTAEERLAVYKSKLIDLSAKYSEQCQQIELLTIEHQQSSATVRQLLITSSELRTRVEDAAKKLNDSEHGLQQQLAAIKTQVDDLAASIFDSTAVTTSDSLGLDELRNDFAIAYGAISYDNDNHWVLVYHYLNLLFSSYHILLTRCLNDHFSSPEVETKEFIIKSGLVHLIHNILNYDSFRIEYNAVLGVGDFTKVKFILEKDFPVYSDRISAIVTHMESIKQQLTVADHGHIIDIIKFVIYIGKLFSSQPKLICIPKF